MNEIEKATPRGPKPPRPGRSREPRCDELRCACGSLVARLVPEGVELKCRRCKRAIVLPLTREPDVA